MSNSTANSQATLGQVIPGSDAIPEQPGSPRRTGSLARVNVSPEAIRMLPADFVKRHRLVPLEIRDGAIHIATSELGNQRVIDDIRLLTGLEVEESLAPAAEILEKIAECYQVTVEQMIENLNPEHKIG